jgi:hypothetical protein
MISKSANIVRRDLGRASAKTLGNEAPQIEPFGRYKLVGMTEA